MENKLKVWMARDEDGRLYLHFTPQLIKGNRQWRLLHSEAEANVDVIKLYSDLFPSVKYEDEEPTEAYITLAEPQEQTKQEQSKQEQNIDWEQRRYEIAKEMLPVLYQQSAEIWKCWQNITWEAAVNVALNFADMLIQKLKEQSE